MVARSRVAGGDVASNGVHPTVSRSRPALTQALVGFVIIIMTCALVYMYRVLDTLHQEQHALKDQLARLAKTGGAGSDVPYAPPRPQLRAGAELEYSTAFASPGGGSVDASTDFLGADARRGEAADGTGSQETGPAAAAAAASDPQGPIERPSGNHEQEHVGRKRDPRRLTAMYTTGTGVGVGCFEIGTGATQTYDVSTGTACNSHGCPDCFITPSGTALTADVQLTISECSSAEWVRGVSRSGVWVYTFINMDSTYTVKVRDSVMTTTYQVPPGQFVQAYCHSSYSGFQHQLAFPSSTIPTLIVDDGITLTAGNFDMSTSSGTFKTGSGTVTINGDTTITGSKVFTTGSGAVTLNGATTVKDNTAFTVGQTDGAGGASVFKGTVQVGMNAASGEKDFVLYGAFTQNDGASSTPLTFTTATGQHTFNGDVATASDKDIVMAGTGAFTTGTGDVQLNGDTTVNVANTFTTGQQAVTLRGDTTISDSKTFTVGENAGSGGATQFKGPVTIGENSNGNSKDFVVYGGITQNDDADGTVKTFTTGLGAVTLNGNVAVAADRNLIMGSGSGTGVFTTGTGDVTLNGHTTITGAKDFTTGTGTILIQGAPVTFEYTPAPTDTVVNFGLAGQGTGGLVSFYGNVHIGGSDQFQSTMLKLQGDFTQLDDHDATEPKNTFTTASGLVSLNGDIEVSLGKDLTLQGASAFTTGTGDVQLNGDTTIDSAKTFTVFGNSINCASLPTDDTSQTYCKVNPVFTR